MNTKERINETIQKVIPPPVERARTILKGMMKKSAYCGQVTLFRGVPLTEFTKEELIDIFSVTLTDRTKCPRCGK